MDLQKAPPWFLWTLGEIGIKEIPGKANNSRIMAYRKIGKIQIDGDEDKVPWCAIFQNAALEQCGVRGTRSALARSFLEWGIGLKRPVLGAIVVLKSARGIWSGHVGQYRGETDTHVYLAGGNQNDAVSIAPFEKDRIIGIRWPASIPLTSNPGVIRITPGKKVTAPTRDA